MKFSSLLAVLALAVWTTACSQEAPHAASNFVCPVKRVAGPKVEHQVVIDILNALNNAFDAALGPDAGHVDQPKVVNKLAATRVDETKMAALAEVSGCAALIDVRSSCALYYDPELGNPLSVFMGMKKSAPLRMQFEAAIARLPNGEPKRAAQSCIKLVGQP
jgi:hypothetical protein